jgi:hypothetical protein
MEVQKALSARPAAASAKWWSTGRSSAVHHCQGVRGRQGRGMDGGEGGRGGDGGRRRPLALTRSLACSPPAFNVWPRTRFVRELVPLAGLRGLHAHIEVMSRLQTFPSSTSSKGHSTAWP